MITKTFDPDKWQLVPKELTPEMCSIYCNEYHVFQTEQELHDAMLFVAPEHLSTKPLTDAEIDSCRRPGLIDSLLDPYDQERSGDEISSVYADLREFARAIEKRIKESRNDHH